MKKPYVLDLDGLDGISDLKAANSAQLEVDAETENLAAMNGEPSFSDKKTNNLLRVIAFLAIGLVGYASYIFLHNQESNEPVSTQVASNAGQLVKPDINASKPDKKPDPVLETKAFKTDNVLPDEKNPARKTSDRVPVNTGIKPNLSVASVESVKKNNAFNAKNTELAANEKVIPQNKIDSKPRLQSRSVQINKDTNDSPLTATKMKNRVGEMDEKPSIDTSLKPNQSVAAVKPVAQPKTLNAKNTGLAANKKVLPQNKLDNKPKHQSRSSVQINKDTNDHPLAATELRDRVGKIDKKPSVNTPSKPNLSAAAVKPVEQQNVFNAEHTTLVANTKEIVQNDTNRKSSKNNSPISTSANKKETKADVLGVSTETAGKTSIDFILPFDFNEMTISNLSNAKLMALKDFAQRCSNVIQVVGHTCNLGPSLSNQAVGWVRAEWVKGLLVERGLTADRIEVVSKGQTKPVASNKTYTGRLLNRRVVVSCLSHSE
ncbi:MAG: OmpA family protein [Methylococcales bacterium]